MSHVPTCTSRPRRTTVARLALATVSVLAIPLAVAAGPASAKAPHPIDPVIVVGPVDTVPPHTIPPHPIDPDWDPPLTADPGDPGDPPCINDCTPPPVDEPPCADDCTPPPAGDPGDEPGDEVHTPPVVDPPVVAHPTFTG